MSTKRDSPYLLVVTVLNGRNFPQRPSESLRIDVRFDGQLLSSLPVPMAEDPIFDVDMAYRLTGAQLTKHKVQRTPIKIDVMKVNRKTKRAEKIGYKILDLRVQAVEIGKPRFAWFPLLGAQALRGKPEIHLGVSIDDDVDAQETARSQKEFTRSARNKEYWVQHQPVLVTNPDGSSQYQLGPSKDSTHIYLLSIIIGYACNLEKFFDVSSKPSPDKPRDFFFHYEFVGNHLTTKPFSDFESTDLSPERISLRIRSYYDLMKEYFLNQRSLKIKLCQGDGHILASADLPLEDAFPAGVMDIGKAVVLEKEVLLLPFPENIFGIPENLHVAPAEHPAVGVAFEISVVNKIDQSDFARTVTLDSFKPFMEEIQNLSRPASARIPGKNVLIPPTSYRSQSVQNLNGHKEDPSVDSRDYASLPRSPRSELAVSSELFPRNWENPRKTKNADGQGDAGYSWGARDAPKNQLHSAATQVSPEPNVYMKDGQTETELDMRLATTQTLVGFESTGGDLQSEAGLPEATRRYVCTIFLYKIRIVSPNCRYTMPIYLRYQYPFFGSAAPIMTRPAVEVSPKLEVILDNNSLTQFSFGCAESQLLRAFRTAPVCIEVWKYGGDASEDELIGQAKLRLDLLLRSEATTLYENEKPYCRRLYDVTLEIVDLQSDKYPKLGELTVCTTLDDYGAVQRQIVDTTTSDSGKYTNDIRRDAPKRSPFSKVNLEEMEKNAAFELEIWKEKEEKKFKAQLKKREDEAMRNISEEWERRTKQQKTFVDESIQKYKDLEAQLRKIILENTQKETALTERERRVSDAERFLKSEKSKLTKDIDEVQQNVIQEYSKRLELEHSAQTLLKAETKQLVGQIDDLKKRKNEQDEQIFRLQEAERQKPQQQREAQLEIDKLTLERNDMERRVATLTESKDHYKQQWAQALQETAKMRDRVQAEQDRRLQEKEREIASLRQQLQRAKERSEDSQRSVSTNQDSQSYRDRSCDGTPRSHRLAMQFNQPKRNGGAGGDAFVAEHQRAFDVNGLDLSPSNGHFEVGKFAGESENEEEDDDLRTQLLKAMEERNLLLKTGIYKPRDSVIVDLDKKVTKLEALLRASRIKF